MSHARSRKITIEEYLAFEESAGLRHEYVDGQIFAMTGATLAHSAISTNLLTNINPQLKGSNCKVYGSDVKVRVEATNSFYYPDIVVDCGIFDQSSVCAHSPVLIFEVLSRSTASIDRREKSAAYQHLQSLKAYLMVHQSKKLIEMWRRDTHGDWVFEEIQDGIISLACCSNTALLIPVDSIYEGLSFLGAPGSQVHEEIEVYSW
ncbi:MAG: Uma2 family endonuclease [Cyanobacteria bacterium]|nr:Uma2 family endonuclease [Cyanobacteriota bacterium]